MDVGFAPLGSDQDERLRKLFELRTNTVRLAEAGVQTVEEFIDALPQAANVTLPMDSALLGSHAHEFEIYLPLTRAQQDPDHPDQFVHTDFETVLKVSADPQKPVRFPDSLFSSNDPDTTNEIHFKGCNIGRDRPDTTKQDKVPLLHQLSAAFSETVITTAPKHFHGIFDGHVSRRKTDKKVAGLGIFEYLAYEFVVLAKKAFKTRDQLIGAYQAANLTLIDGTVVDPNQWRTWVPRSTAGQKFTMTVPLGRTLGKLKTLAIKAELRADKTPFGPWTIDMDDSQFPQPSNYESFLHDEMKADEVFDPTKTDFPFYERWGYKNFEDFFSGMRWDIKRKKIKKEPGRSQLWSQGLRVEYVLLIPITDPGTGNLLFNFFKGEGSSAASFVGIPETNEQLYARV